MNNKIFLIGRPVRQIELPASTAIQPGMLIEEIAGGTLQPHATAGGQAEIIIAQEDALQGKSCTDNYAIGDQVSAVIPSRGDKCLLLLKATFNYPIGTKLISAGDGTLKPTTGTPITYVAVVIAALNLSASGALNTLNQCRIN